MSEDHEWYAKLDADLSAPLFKPGDIAQLKVGGPAMAVQDVLSEGWVSCVWFRKREVYVFDFHTTCLVRLETN